jgi:hypothetical protein
MTGIRQAVAFQPGYRVTDAQIKITANSDREGNLQISHSVLSELMLKMKGRRRLQSRVI